MGEISEANGVDTGVLRVEVGVRGGWVRRGGDHGGSG